MLVRPPPGSVGWFAECCDGQDFEPTRDMCGRATLLKAQTTLLAYKTKRLKQEKEHTLKPSSQLFNL